MNQIEDIAREIGTRSPPAVRYSICTIVTRREQYLEMLQSLRAGGFEGPDCEYLFIDNSAGNRLDAFAGYNLFLTEARGAYVVLCHQDIVLLEEGREKLDRLLEDLNARDPDWGVCGNAGMSAGGLEAIRITDARLRDQGRGLEFPVRVVGLDENFIVARREANLALSHDLKGFHWYGADLCIIADVLGFHAYVIDFHLMHKSAGSLDDSFFDLRWRVEEKYRRAFRWRWQHVTTHRPIFLSCFAVVSRTAILLARVRKKLFGGFSVHPTPKSKRLSPAR